MFVKGVRKPLRTVVLRIPRNHLNRVSLGSSSPRSAKSFLIFSPCPNWPHGHQCRLLLRHLQWGHPAPLVALAVRRSGLKVNSKGQHTGYCVYYQRLIKVSSSWCLISEWTQYIRVVICLSHKRYFLDAARREFDEPRISNILPLPSPITAIG